MELCAGSLDGGTPVHILSYNVNLTNGVDFTGRYAAPGYLLFVRGGILTAQQFDEKRLVLAGEPVPIAEPAGPFSVSTQQTLVYRVAQAISGAQQIVWMDRDGKPGPSVSMPGNFESLSLSRDGHRLVFDQKRDGNWDIWVTDLDRGVPTRLTSDPAVDAPARFSPDGKQIVFSSRRLGGARRMFIRSSVGTGTDQPLPSGNPFR